MRIGINCGHTISGTTGSGAVGFLNESNETRNIGNRLIDYLCSSGVDVVNCTNDMAASVSQNLSEICRMANAQKLDAFISIHLNSGGGKGTEVYTYSGDDVAYAGKIKNALTCLGFKDRGIKRGNDLYVLRNTKAKACLVEVCFVDSETDYQLYNDIGPDIIARTIAQAITGSALNVSRETDILDVESVNDIVWELSSRGIISETNKWLKKLEDDADSYWLARKCANYFRRKNV